VSCVRRVAQVIKRKYGGATIAVGDEELNSALACDL
jgi:hypothetical protein